MRVTPNFFWLSSPFILSSTIQNDEAEDTNIYSVFFISCSTHRVARMIYPSRQKCFFHIKKSSYKACAACGPCTCRGGWSAKRSIQSIIIIKSTLLGRAGTLPVGALMPSHSYALHGHLHRSNSAGERRELPWRGIECSQIHHFTTKQLFVQQVSAVIERRV